ncbi:MULTISPECIES: helix-turn-helix domain-containing protein [unclassified Chelatococcus]|uniref:helix-turn-helix domain-containing protein n=1 Tax=unclassified Chelatococcus TaxID=2638111 RepID=UPI001BCDC462|nr:MULTISPECIES: helix-turn-helix domain-containing protein [unclassified Chelatococcus]MBS7743112.1 helix-turn-helix domain-containing protein [Chelatococcus sp. HY11]MBX3541770.1 helix-turn-helix domain-containing protein [Chelatococcus sp.]MCO5074338.1 helix-turn-helix domain-containing protein [Chelatococcus sp.]
METIPIYALFGEAVPDREHEWLHWETIVSRSSRHDFRIAPHRHEQFFQILEVTSGRVRATIDGATYDLAGPAIVVVPALTVHGYVFSRDVVGVVLTLMERDVQNAGRDVGEISAQPRVLSGFGMDDVHAAIADLITEADRREIGHGVAMPALITLLLVALARAGRIDDHADPRFNQAARHATAFRALVDRRYRSTRVIGDYAEALGISQPHLNRISRQVLGISALQIIERRIALEARRQLLFSSLTIKQIGAELGYDDPAYFTRFLTRMLGVAPSQYRKTARTSL